MRLWEKLGDLCCKVKSYQKGVQYYQNQLSCAEILKRSEEELSMIHFSLACTFLDLKDYKQALSHYKTQLDLQQGSPREECKTWLHIAAARRKDGAERGELDRCYQNALELAKMAKEPQLQQKVLKALSKSQSPSSSTEEEGGSTDDTDSEEGTEVEEEMEDGELLELSHLQHSANDKECIGLSKCQRASTASKKAGFPRPRETRQMQGSAKGQIHWKWKCNRKGESPLHRACITGNVRQAQTLIDKGHPLCVRDNAGWTPLHEACNHGHLEIVHLLLDSGAPVNDADDALCDGTSVLHDALSSGRLEVVELLINRGACLTVRDTEGHSPADCFYEWTRRLNEELSTEAAQRCAIISDILNAASPQGLNPCTEDLECLHSQQLHTESSAPPPSLVRPDSTLGCRCPARRGRGGRGDGAQSPVGSPTALARPKRKSSRCEEMHAADPAAGPGTGSSNVWSSEEDDDFLPSPRPLKMQRRARGESSSANHSRPAASRKHRLSRCRSAPPTEHAGTVPSAKPGPSSATGPISRAEAGQSSASGPIHWARPGPSSASGPIPRAEAGQSSASGPIHWARPGPSSASGPIPRATAGQSSASRPIHWAKPGPSSASGPIPRAEAGQSSASGPIHWARPGLSSASGPIPRATARQTSVSTTLNISTANQTERSLMDLPPSFPENGLGDGWLEVDRSATRPESRLPVPAVPTPAVGEAWGSGASCGTGRQMVDLPAQSAASAARLQSPGGSAWEVPSSSTMITPSRSQPSIKRTVTSPLPTLPAPIRVKVRVKHKLFLIPVPHGASDACSVSWLAGEAAARYKRECGVRPLLSLTSDGALLSPHDLVIHVLQDNEEVLAEVLSWDLPPLSDRYKRACHSLAVAEDVSISKILQLQEKGPSIDLSALSLTMEHLTPILRALKLQTTTRELRLSANRLSDSAVGELLASLATMPNLTLLDLSSNHITHQGLRKLCGPDTHATDSPFQSLEELNLGLNPLGDSSSQSIASLLRSCPVLSTLRLQACGLTAKFLQHFALSCTMKGSRHLKTLNLSHNALGLKGVQFLLKSLHHEVLSSLEMAAVLGDQADRPFVELVVKYLAQDGCTLTHLNLSENSLTDDSISDFARCLPSFPSLAFLDLSQNSAISSGGLEMLLAACGERDSWMEVLELSGCSLHHDDIESETARWNLGELRL
uniref:tonsoku-like protein n=1 Tax=Pristiophorus japonicus TaxID=55135 RepID=UPI00398EA53F